jgi:hypothetical protein
MVGLLVALVLYRFGPIPQPERQTPRETAADAEAVST